MVLYKWRRYIPVVSAACRHYSHSNPFIWPRASSKIFDMSIELSDYRYNSSLQAILGEATELRQLKLNYNLQKIYTCGSDKVMITCFIF